LHLFQRLCLRLAVQYNNQQLRGSQSVLPSR
jgi:hypothetical protein